MLSFNNFLVEAASEDKLKHLEHLEDHVINAGADGFAHAVHNLEDVHGKLKGGKNNTTVMTKYDGSPSIVFGHNPENGKFFVASKSIFNKNPKLNYDENDVDANHGHAPGLAQKLKAALQHLPKVTPKEGVYQGDLMHSGVKNSDNPYGDIEEKGGKYHFKPNTITYSTDKNSKEGLAAGKSKLGVVVHTAYKGKTIESMKADYTPDVSHFTQHPDVHLINNREDVHSAKLTPEQETKFKRHLNAAKKAFAEAPMTALHAISGHEEHLKNYVNSTVRDQTRPTVNGYIKHLESKHRAAISKLKSDKAIAEKTASMHNELATANRKRDHFEHVLKMHYQLQRAKDELTHALSSAKFPFEHYINDKKVKPEGFVVVRNNRPSKFVDRDEFSRENFAARPR